MGMCKRGRVGGGSSRVDTLLLGGKFKTLLKMWLRGGREIDVNEYNKFYWPQMEFQIPEFLFSKPSRISFKKISRTSRRKKTRTNVPDKLFFSPIKPNF